LVTESLYLYATANRVQELMSVGVTNDGFRSISVDKREAVTLHQ